MPHPVIHSSYTIDRTDPHAPAPVCRAFTDPAQKRRWFAASSLGPLEALAHDLAAQR